MALVADFVISAVILVAVVLWPAVAYGQSSELMDSYKRAGVLHALGRYQEALPFAEEALRLGEREFGLDHPDVAQGLENYAALLRMTGRSAEATRMEARAKATQARHAEQNPAN